MWICTGGAYTSCCQKQRQPTDQGPVNASKSIKMKRIQWCSASWLSHWSRNWWVAPVNCDTLFWRWIWLFLSIRDWDSAIPDRCTTNSTSTQELRSGSMGKKGTTLATSRYGSDRPMCQVFGLPTLSAHRKTPKPSSLKSSRVARSCWIYVCIIYIIFIYYMYIYILLYIILYYIYIYT